MSVHWVSIILSLLIVAGGLIGARTLTRVDQDLRVIHAEYTLAATDLGHVNGELIRYRSSVLRAIEADTKDEFARIAASFLQKRKRINMAIDRFVRASNSSAVGKRIDSRELAELKAVREKLEAYLTSSHRTMQLMEQRWTVSSPFEAKRLHDRAEENAANDAGAKFIDVTLELDRLLDVVAGIAGEVKKDADTRLKLESFLIVSMSLLLAVLVLTMPVGARPRLR